ncbi:hypothetical protein FGIG_07379 [Fasciola gigantica]|uniref:Uncharacterized protein n=1 Tax=Fasciola gigantica TaxID=46835 RepID=A0A504YCC7_FASGI|nr:hypothetical protein FGIG_07379 [Fasciola gigantica]
MHAILSFFVFRRFPKPPKVDKNRVLFNNSLLVSLDDTFESADVHKSQSKPRHKSRELLLSITYTLQDEATGKLLRQLFKDNVASL